MKLCIVLLLILSVLFARAKPNRTQAPMVFTHVTIIDVTGSQPRRDATVVITGDRIFFDRKALDKMLSEAEGAANRER